MALKNLLSLSDRVQRYSTVNGDLGICHGCDRKADSLKGCKKCLLFRYCDKVILQQRSLFELGANSVSLSDMSVRRLEQ